MEVTRASTDDVDGFLALAAEVERWFGPMVDDTGFHSALDKNIRRGTALVLRAANGTGLLGGLLTGGRTPTYLINWLVVAGAVRGRGVGHTLVKHAVRGFSRPCRVDVITFGADHPGAVESGARAFYERLGFHPGEKAPDGPEGGSRLWYHLTLTGPRYAPLPQRTPP
jgi:GNAT superfamily N-acetyltransferase